MDMLHLFTIIRHTINQKIAHTVFSLHVRYGTKYLMKFKIRDY